MRIILLSAVMMAGVFAQHRGGGPGPGIPARAPAPAGRIHNAPPSVRTLRPRPRTVVVPYPVYYGGGYYDAAPPAAAYAEQSPGVIVNPDFRPDGVNPQIIDYSNLPADPAVDENGLRDDEPTIFLIALTDRSVVAAIAYWVDGDTLNWVSRDAKQNHLSLALVDRDFSKQLNDERHVEFKLPPAK